MNVFATADVLVSGSADQLGASEDKGFSGGEPEQL